MLVAVAVTLILVFTLKKGGGGGDTPDTDDHFNPYKVLDYDAASNTYTLGRIQSLQFQYPYNETDNNKLLNTFKLQGTPDTKAYRFNFFSGVSKESAAVTQ